MAVLLMAAVALAGCDAPVSGHASAHAASLGSPPAGAGSLGAAAGEAGDAQASSPAARSDDRPDSVPSSSTATIRLVPTGDRSSVDIRVDGSVQVYAADIVIKFDATQLQVADADTRADGVQIQPGQVPRPDLIVINNADNRTGLVRYVVSQLGEPAPFSHSGVVATISWQQTADHDATLAVESMTLATEDARPIDATVVQ